MQLEPKDKQQLMYFKKGDNAFDMEGYESTTRDSMIDLFMDKSETGGYGVG